MGTGASGGDAGSLGATPLPTSHPSIFPLPGHQDGLSELAVKGCRAALPEALEGEHLIGLEA